MDNVMATQQEAQEATSMCLLASWIMAERRYLSVLFECGCTEQEAGALMRAEEN